MIMPMHLRIVIGFTVFSVVSQIYGIVKFSNFAVPSRYMIKLIGIIIWIGIIKGLMNRSNLSRQLAIGLSILSLLASSVALYFYWTVPFPTEEDFKIVVFWDFVFILTAAYTMWALSSKKVVEYFVTE